MDKMQYVMQDVGVAFEVRAMSYIFLYCTRMNALQHLPQEYSCIVVLILITQCRPAFICMYST